MSSSSLLLFGGPLLEHLLKEDVVKSKVPEIVRIAASDQIKKITQPTPPTRVNNDWESLGNIGTQALTKFLTK